MKYFLSTCLSVLQCAIYRYTLYNFYAIKRKIGKARLVSISKQIKSILFAVPLSHLQKTPNMCTVAGLYLYFFVGKESDSFALCSY